MSAESGPYQILHDLGPRLSPNAAIHLPGSDDFARTTSRWNPGQIRPSYIASVEVGSEEDVAETIKFANRHGVPFLAQSGGHGFWKGLSDVKGGIQIYLRGLNSIEVNGRNGGKTAFIGGGTLSIEVTKTLFAIGKHTVTGLCATTSLAGPALGGGHGFLQGHYGFMADNIVSANVVLADGSIVVANKDSHPDLYWALRGAGHNFGIVTSLEYKIYDIPTGIRWTVTNYMFKQDKLEQVMATANQFIGPEMNAPRELLLWCNLIHIPAIDPDNAIVNFKVQYEGTDAQAAPFRAPFEALEPLSTTTETVTEYSKLHDAMGFGEDSVGGQRTFDVNVITASLLRFDPQAMRKFYDIISEHARTPGAGTSFGMLEVYASNGAKEVPADSTAVPPEERRSNILIGGLLVHDIGNAEQAELAWSVGSKLRAALVEGIDVAKHGKPGSYVNYANGEQSVEEMYGHEPWRLEKLRDLKQRYDPERRFRFYAPI
ncbi:FAD-binding domain-containing protein [Pseudovirgaria hyperparasitica]|uniref:FAD-binding domain-containing protein n=1 Tax=Pseudovirgaria hyperparasitica TaxID=470096 RepID=A0A6A6W1S8_9PEZI|nr:FAD-binding domain-containing protein [Pseudovirgaria hyperparasitica]KAF2756099.1 FAD-binding domain-containing protein [Pseudovirgaria hyperparasitica]